MIRLVRCAPHPSYPLTIQLLTTQHQRVNLGHAGCIYLRKTAPNGKADLIGAGHRLTLDAVN